MIPRPLSIAVAVVLTACSSDGGGETGNPVADIPIAVSVRSSEPNVIALDPGDSGTLIEEAWFSIGDVAFLDDAACAELGDIDVPGASRLIADLTRDNRGLTLDVERGSYCGLVVPLPNDNAELPGDAPDELASNSIVLRGQRADGMPFVLAYPEQDELELAAADRDIEIGDAPFLLSFDIATLMRDVDLEAAAPNEDGVIRIDGAENRALLERFELNLECSVQLFEDLDDDGQLDSDEPLRASCHEPNEEDENEDQGE